MSKKNRYDIDLMLATRAKTKTSMDPADYVNAKVPIYAANVNLRRQIPEIRDGLIPVQRRILLMFFYQMSFFILYFNKI
mgnify:CR=1 FL=1